MNGWVRVTKANKCPICDHDSWCCIGTRWVCCMRSPSEKPCHNGGYLHPVGDHSPRPVRRPEPIQPTIDALAIMRRLWHATTDSRREDLAVKLGVSVESLRAIGASWNEEKYAWAFPMFSGERQCIGIRLRADNGAKWAVAGSRQGIFWPRVPPSRTVYFCEGPTDTAAAITLGLFALGRPSCTGSINYAQVAVNRLGCSQAVLVADNDAPGIRGAKQLADELQVPCAQVLLPCKDLREFVRLGGTRQVIDSMLDQAVWTLPKNK